MKFFPLVSTFLLAAQAWGADAQLISLLAPGSTMVAGLDVQQTKASPFGQFLLSQLGAAAQLDKLRSTTGFDRLFQLLDTAGNLEPEGPTYPPYNIERLSENEYRISMAVAGFTRDDIKIEVKEQTLSVRGERKSEPEAEHREFLHRGIAQRAFERRFQLADHVEVRGADLRDGLLHIELQRNIPERMKPRQIPIGATEEPKQIAA